MNETLYKSYSGVSLMTLSSLLALGTLVVTPVRAQDNPSNPAGDQTSPSNQTGDQNRDRNTNTNGNSTQSQTDTRSSNNSRAGDRGSYSNQGMNWDGASLA